MKYLHLIALLIAFGFFACQRSSNQTSDMNHKHTNALIHETSPYLLQHAHNPVDWRPWNDETLKEARESNKMMIISVGYSACHWCHVMEHESFEDSTVAAFMNTFFIPIKVDREERPDVDDVYMTACQLSNSRGCGWPLNAFALADGRPVWAGTYFPKDQWMNILQQFSKLQENNPQKLEEFARNLQEGFKNIDAVDVPDENADISDIDFAGAMNQFKSQIDPTYGGRSGAPKFPMPNNYELLLKWGHEMNDEDATNLVYTTLDNMAQGGIFDPIAGGFARYSVDGQWKVPHFEKMLYDNAQLLDLYSQAYKKSKNPLYKKTIDKIVDWLAAEMLDESGGFYSALDADSEGEEGKFYVWTFDEINDILGSGTDLDIFIDRYQITKPGNWEHGNNILHHKTSIQKLAKKYNLTEDEIDASIEASLLKLKPIRDKRVRPGLDDKILTGWNALLAHGLIEAYFATGNEKAKSLADNNIKFLLKTQLEEDGRMHRTYKKGKSTINAFLEDYAATIRALIRYYQLTLDEQYLHMADEITQYVLTHFSEDDTQLFFYTSDLDSPLVTRKKELSDNVIPASTSIMGRNLLALGHYLNKEEYIKRAHDMALSMKNTVWNSAQPSFYSNWLQLYNSLLNPPFEVAILGKDAMEKAHEWQAHYTPNALVLGGSEEGTLALLKDKLQEGSTMIYVCQNKVCKFPVEEVDKALTMLK